MFSISIFNITDGVAVNLQNLVYINYTSENWQCTCNLLIFAVHCFRHITVLL